MGITMRCPYCEWAGEQPSPAEFEFFKDYLKAMEIFEEEQENHSCPNNNIENINYEGAVLNELLTLRVIFDFFFESFRNTAQIEEYLHKKMKDTENDFLMYSEHDIENAIKTAEMSLEKLKELRDRDFDTSKFEDHFYYSK